ncbi:MAG: hypothetical protein EF806_02255 [Candidatus Methanoliparum thermophilum]|uniref:Cobalt transporter n=1 Tax=Methanoliparum thermophilum TaxID=2491083 RepID=A0A520KSK6_METT2|nr:hypothetical protein [Candidatus Methanoliparum sp. LAM-1]RZN64892.1 MAG: hypothetical protein EF806_02255 [Candidatus Methanoliparum thermophilum]BDC36234.1 hypothetical protein MTLP_09160 [Candidatus Methanoliparum sp. LAM-1]
MIFDKFTRTALVLMIIIVFMIMLFSYIGSEHGIKGSDDIVSEIIIEETGKEEISIIPTVSDFIGEEITYTIVGIIAGFVVGYFWRDIFNNKE